jgi:hypothetical protein
MDTRMKASAMAAEEIHSRFAAAQPACLTVSG